MFPYFSSVAPRNSVVGVLAIASCVLLVNPAKAQLTEVQKDKLRTMLSQPKVDFGAKFSISGRNGFELDSWTDPTPDEEKARATVRVLQGRKPSLPLEQARYYINRSQDFTTLGATEKAKESLSQAEQICLAGSKSTNKTEQARFLSLLADVQDLQGNNAQAFKTAQAAAALAPQIWEPQAEIGYLYLNKATAGTAGNFFDFARWKTVPPTSEQLTQIEEAVNQANTAFIKAVRLAEASQPAPKKRDPQVYYSRASGIIGKYVVLEVVKAQRQAISKATVFDVNTSSLYLTAMTSSEMRATAKSGAECATASPFGYGFIGMSEMIATKGTISKATEDWAQNELRTIYDAPQQKPNIRQTAYATAGLLYMMSGKYDLAQPLFEKSLVIKPDDSTVARCYVGSLVSQQPPNYAKAERFLADSLRTQDTVTKRLMLAKVLDKQGQLAQAEIILEAAEKAAPKNAAVCVALATVRLKRSNANTTSDELAPTGYLLQKLGGNDYQVTGDLWTSFMESAVVFHTLYGQLDEAKQTSNLLLKYVPDNELAKTFLSFAP